MERGIGGRAMNPSAINPNESVVRRSSGQLRLIHLRHYARAILSVGGALAASLLLQYLHFRVPAAPLLLFAVAISSWYGGTGPAVLAVVLSMISFYWYFVEPVRTVYIYPSEIPFFIIFVGFAALLSWFSTIRRRVEKELREQADLLNLTHDTVFVMDMEGVIKYWNRGAEQRYGWTAEQAAGRVVHELLKTVFPAPLEAIKAEVKCKGRWEGELVHSKKDGTLVIVASRWSLQRDGKGTPVAILETNNDITERKRSEEKIRQQEMELRQVLDFTPQLVSVFGPNRKHLYANRPSLEYLGLTLQEWQGITDPLCFFHPDDRERLAKDVYTGSSSDVPHEFEARFGKKQGPYRWFLFRDNPLRDEQGQIMRWYLSATDIEDRKHTEQVLRRSEAYLTEAQRLSHTGSWAADGTSREPSYWSEEMFRLYGFQPQEGLPKRQQSLQRIHPEDRDAVKKASDRTFLEKLDSVVDFRLLLPDGTVKYTHALAHPVLGCNGELVEVVGTNVDITERKQAEEKLRRLNRELRAISDCNQILLRATDEQNLLGEICRIVCQEAGYLMAWVAYAERDETKSVRPIAWSGAEAGYLATIGITWADTERGRGPTGTAIRSGKSCCIEDFATDPRLAPWRESVLQRGFRSGIGLPLKDEHANAFGSLTIYSADPDAFTLQEIRLLEELAADMAFGIITLRSQAARKLAEQEVALLSFALDNVQEAAFLIDESGRFRYVNEEGCRVLGYTRAELLGLGVLDIDVDFPVGRWLDHWSDLKEQRSLSFESRHRTRDGRIFPVEISANYFEYGGRAYNLALARDITERRRAQEALRRSEAYLAEAQRLTHTASWASDGKTREVVYWSEEVYRIFGFERQNGLPTRDQLWQRIHPEDREKVKEHSERTFREKVDYEVEYRIVLPDGTLKHLHSLGHPVLGPEGDVVEVVGTNVDITERKRAEEALRESETLLRTFVDHTADAFFMLDSKHGTIIDVNQPACASLGYTRQELIGMTPLAFDMNLDRATLESVAQHTAAGETVLFDRHWHRRKDGSLFPVEVHSSVFWHGGRRFLLKVARDISDRVRAEEQRERLRELEANLAHINRVSMMGELAASIAHEVNQPLSGVVSNGSACLRWLAGDAPNVEEAREAARRIVRDGKRAGEVIARTRALTKRAVTTPEKLDVNETFREVVALVGDEAKRNSVTIRTSFADGVFSVLGDRVQLQQVVLNLVMNAIEAMNSVGDRPRELVITTQNADSDHIHVTVRDSGPGLAPETIGKIFDPFYSTKPGGMGMGLSISRSIVEVHGGRLWATKNDGPGTAFHFTVPKYHKGLHAGATGT